MGNLKFCISKTDSDIDIGQQNYRIFLAGSTHKQENPIILSAFLKIKHNISDVKLLIAPRHLERTSEIEALCKKYGLKYGNRSKNDKFSDDIDVIILDTLGELKFMYPISDIAFIGGSFNKTGGHNPLEASICAIPVVSGPNVHNFKDIYSILTKVGAAKIVQTETELCDNVVKLLQNKEEYDKYKKACADVFEEQSGAEDFVINMIKNLA